MTATASPGDAAAVDAAAVPVAVVTGGNRGLGRAIAEALVDAGHRVVVTWRTDPPPPHLTGVRCDVRDPDQVEAAFAEIEADHGPVGVLVANAASAERNLVIRMRPAAFADVVDTNLVGSFTVARRAAQTMVRRRAGRIVFISSVAGFVGPPGVASYSASKSGLVGLCRTMARELGSRSITANVVVPGLLENARAGAPGGDDWVAATPLRREGTLAEAAAVVRWLCSDDAAFVTGTVFPVDGGYSMGIG